MSSNNLEINNSVSPGNLRIAQEVCCECMCGGMNCNYLHRTWRCCNKYFVYGFVISLNVLAGLAVLGGLGYLLFGPFASAIEVIMFADIKCSIWGGCEVHAIDQNGKQLSAGCVDDVCYLFSASDNNWIACLLALFIFICFVVLILIIVLFVYNMVHYRKNIFENVLGLNFEYIRYYVCTLVCFITNSISLLFGKIFWSL